MCMTEKFPRLCLQMHIESWYVSVPVYMEWRIKRRMWDLKYAFKTCDPFGEMRHEFKNVYQAFSIKSWLRVDGKNMD